VSSVRQAGDRDRVRDASDIVRIVGQHVALRPHGREYVGLCPFHDDHKPSMTVVPHKQMFHCFVCGSGGDVFSFVQKYHKMEFREALEHLAEQAGIALTPWRRTEGEAPLAETSRADLVRASQAASDFFRAIYRHPEHGAAAREIVRRRGITDEMVEAFGIGASPDRWDGLLVTLQNKGLDPALFVEAGLLKRRESGGGMYDVFRNRLMFPIRDQIGRVIAFGARKIRDEDEPKYLNSPETRLFKKAGTLFGLDRAAREIMAKRTAIITEGYTDTIACHQAGITNVVATLGTALTPDHAAILRRLCDTVVLLFDGDAAGQKAADRAVEVFFAERLDVKIARLSTVTSAKDPDELLKGPDGPDAGRALLERAVDTAPDLLDYRFRRMKSSLAGAGMAALEQATTDELKRLVDLGLGRASPLRRQFIIKQLSNITGLGERAIAAAIPAGRSRPRDQAPAAERSRILSPHDHIIGCILCDPALWSAGAEVLGDGDDQPRLAVIAAMRALVASGESPTLSAVLGALESDQAKGLAVSLAATVDQVTDRDARRLGEHFRGCLERIAMEQPDGPAPQGITDRLAQVRARHAAHGGDRRVLGRSPS
jgi:DNA primase